MASTSSGDGGAGRGGKAVVTVKMAEQKNHDGGGGGGGGVVVMKKLKRERGSTAKERISKMPPCTAGKRSSIYRGVTRSSLSLSLIFFVILCFLQFDFNCLRVALCN